MKTCPRTILFMPTTLQPPDGLRLQMKDVVAKRRDSPCLHRGAQWQLAQSHRAGWQAGRVWTSERVKRLAWMT